MYRTIILATLIGTTPAMASGIYLGANFQTAQPDFTSAAIFAPGDVSGYDAHLGYKTGHFALEASFASATAASTVRGKLTSEQITKNLTLRGPTLDGLVYPWHTTGLFQPFVTAGAAWQNATVSSMDSIVPAKGPSTLLNRLSVSGSSFGWRVGIGFESELVRGFTLRTIARYAEGGSKIGLRDQVMLSVGVNVSL